MSGQGLRVEEAARRAGERHAMGGAHVVPLMGTTDEIVFQVFSLSS